MSEFSNHNRALKGEGLAITLSDAHEQVDMFFPYEHDDPGLAAEMISKDAIFSVVQWLGENRYIPTQDRKAFLDRDDNNDGGKLAYADNIVRGFQEFLANTSPQKFSEFTGKPLQDCIQLFSQMVAHNLAD